MNFWDVVPKFLFFTPAIYSVPIEPILGHSGGTVSAAYSWNTSSVFSVLFTVMFTLFLEPSQIPLKLEQDIISGYRRDFRFKCAIYLCSISQCCRYKQWWSIYSSELVSYTNTIHWIAPGFLYCATIQIYTFEKRFYGAYSSYLITFKPPLTRTSFSILSWSGFSLWS